MAAPTNPSPSKLDSTQILQRVMDESEDRLRVDADITIDEATIIVETSYLTDSMAIGDPVTDNILKINSDGSLDNRIYDSAGNALTSTSGALNVNSTGSSTVSGTVDTNLNGLDNWQTSQYTVGTSAVQLAATALTNRSSMSVKIIATSSTDIVYIGNSSSVTTSTGYPLFNGDSIQMDLTPSGSLWAIGTSPGQIASVLEIGG
jgi:hypothetical protein